MLIRELHELNELEKLSVIDMSYSRLDTALGPDWGCEAKYYFSYILKEPRGWSPYSALGSAVHEVLEDLIEPTTTYSDHPRFEAHLDEILPKHDPDGMIPEKLRLVGIDCIRKVLSKDKFDKVWVKEASFELVVGRSLFRGFIDRIDIDHEKKDVFIWDYKTGSKEIPAKHIHKNLQVGLYALVASIWYPNYKINAGLYYLRTGRKKGHLFSEGDLKKVYYELIRLTDILLNKRAFHYTPDTRICGWCDHSKSGICPRGKYYSKA